MADVKVSFDGGATVEVMVAGGPNSRESEVMEIHNGKNGDKGDDGEDNLVTPMTILTMVYFRSTTLPAIPGGQLHRLITLPLDQVA